MAQNKDYTLRVGDRLISLATPIVMGILNATPDSFYAGSRVQTEREIAARANEIVAQGGTIIDVGAFSTRPGAAEVTAEDEMLRLGKALGIVRREQPDAIVSVDTFRPDVARMAVEEYGANIINDVSEGGLTGIAGQRLPESADDVPAMFAMVARLRVPYVLMSVRSTVSTMMPHLAREVRMLNSLGVHDILIDPGFGFGKTLSQNYALLDNMHLLGKLGLPLLVGVSRKSMIYKLLECTPEESLPGTIAVNTIALQKGASVLRVHDVVQAMAAIKVVEACRHQNKNLDT